MSFKEDNLIQNKTFEFALEIIKFYEICKSQMNLFWQSKFFVAELPLVLMQKKRQQLKVKDFISKLSIANKEA